MGLTKSEEVDVFSAKYRKFHALFYNPIVSFWYPGLSVLASQLARGIGYLVKPFDMKQLRQALES